MLALSVETPELLAVLATIGGTLVTGAGIVWRWFTSLVDRSHVEARDARTDFLAETKAARNDYLAENRAARSDFLSHLRERDEREGDEA